MLDERLLCDQLRRAGLTPGDAVIVHSSLSSLGHVDGGAATVVRALLQILKR
jgi:aminoglycoside 3-N-acetyltransferase